MRYLVYFFSILTGMLPALANADDYREVPITLSQIYIPQGFDDNDEIVIVLDGEIMGGCQKIGKTDTVISEGTIYITQYVKHFPSIPCMEISTAFTEELKLGVLPHGTYDVDSLGDAHGVLRIEEASHAGPDDHIYAPIEKVSIDSYTADLIKVRLEGRYSPKCIVWKQPKIEVTGSTMQLLPIVEIDQSPECRASEARFVKTFEFPVHVESGRYLLHTRSLNGNAINEMFDVY